MSPEDPLRQGVGRKGQVRLLAGLGDKQMLSEGHPSSPGHPAGSTEHLTPQLGASKFSGAAADPQRPRSGERRMIRGSKPVTTPSPISVHPGWTLNLRILLILVPSILRDR